MNNTFIRGYVDLSWILNRNMNAIKYNQESCTAGDIVRTTFQTLSKFVREFNLSVDKLIFFNDTYLDDYPGYIRTKMLSSIGGDYKGDRVHMTEEIMLSIVQDPNTTFEEKRQARKEFIFQSAMREAKEILKNELCKFGFPTVSYPGFEFDDLCYIAARSFLNEDKPSVIISKDSDLLYSATPNCYVWQPPLKNTNPKLWSYQDVCDSMPKKFQGVLKPYQYFSLINAMGYGHNNCKKLYPKGLSSSLIVSDILERQDYSRLSSKEEFEKQLESFKVFDFPGIEEVKKLMNIDYLNSIGSIGGVSDFQAFCKGHGFWISEKYYTETVGKFDQKLFCGL